jgi:hypothetical protein
LKDELIQPQLIEKLRMLKELGIETMSTFTLGHDDDPADVEPLIHDFCGRIRANLAEFTIHTPFPGTRRFAELRAAGRCSPPIGSGTTARIRSSAPATWPR